MKTYLFLFLPFLLFLSCSKEEKSINTKILDDIVIEDGEPFIGELYNVEFIEKNKFLTYDNRTNIKKFENYVFSKVLGRKGNGPCEHGSINNFTVFGDTLYILDREQGKFLKYGISNNSIDNCIEIFDETVIRLSGIQVIQKEPIFIRGSLVKSLESDTPIIYRFIRDSKEIIPTNILLKDLNIDLLGMPLRLSMASDKLGNEIYFYMPMTKKVFIYDAVNNTLRNFQTDIYLAKDQNIFEIQDIRKFSELMSNEVEVVFDLFAFKDKIALGYRKGTGEDQIWGLKLYDQEGRKLAEKTFDNRVIYMDKSEKLMTLKLNIGKEKNPYSFEVYEYSVE